MTRARSLSCTVTPHELMLLALYRALDPDQQRNLSSQAYRGINTNAAALRFRDEGQILGVQELPASTLRPFLESGNCP